MEAPGGRDRRMGLWGIVQPSLPLHIIGCGLQTAAQTSRPPINVSSLLASFMYQTLAYNATVSFTARTPYWLCPAIKQNIYLGMAVNHSEMLPLPLYKHILLGIKVNSVQKQNPVAIFQNSILPTITHRVLWSTKTHSATNHFPYRCIRC